MIHERICRACRTRFETTNSRKIFCGSDCSKNKSRTNRRLANDITFIGVDGEGVDRPDGNHEYIMLSVGSDTLFSGGRQLTLSEILTFLWQCFLKDSDAAYVGFFLGYDFIHWQKLLPEHTARLLLTDAGIVERTSSVKSRPNPYPDPVVWEGWEIDVMAGRRFKLRPHVCIRSKWNVLCRNRTCGRETDLPSTEDIYSRLVSPDIQLLRLDDGVEWAGTTSAFWRNFTTKIPSKKVSQWMYICDTGPFWQTSFINVINPAGWDVPICSKEEYETIVQGKEGRGIVIPYPSHGDNDRANYFQQMVHYNTLENDILGRVTQRLNQGFMNDSIPIKLSKNEWYGPGRAAQRWMDMLHTKVADRSAVEFNKAGARGRSKDSSYRFQRANESGLLNADIYMSMPPWFYEAAQASYYGGWFEQFLHGHCGNAWEYDINSAYPYIIASLPCLHGTDVGHNGQYIRREDGDTSNSWIELPTSAYRLLHCTVSGTNPYIGAMPYRTRQGNILRPSMTKGWYWAHEVEAAQRAKLIDTVDVHDWVAYLPCDCAPPFNPTDIGIERMYALRLAAGKNSPEGKAFKLVYNSAYGKTAQSVGTPKYSNPVYASLITAGCRTLILDTISTHPMGASAVSMVATDGVYFTGVHPSLALSSTTLGSFDSTEKKNLTQLMPGVYWDDTSRERVRNKLAPKLKSRGINARDLANEIEYLDACFAQSHFELSRGNEYQWPEIEFRVRFLLESAKSALNRGKWNEAGKVSHTSVRRISSNPQTKRIPIAYRDSTTGLTRTTPYGVGPTGLETTPYQKSFGYLLHQEVPTVFGDTVDEDGEDPMMYWRTVMGL